MSQVRHLVKLQQIDTQLDQAKARLEEIDAALSDNSAVRKAAARTEKAAQTLTTAQLALKRAEQDVQAQQDKIARNQKALYGGGKSPKELEDLQMESGALARYLEKLEEVQLEAMIAFEEAEAEDQAAGENLVSAKKQVADDNIDLTAERQSLEARAAELQIEREAAAAPITPELIVNYEKLRQTRFGLAVTSMQDGSCVACGNSLTFAQAQAARSPSKIVYCGVCRRIVHA